MQKTKLIFLGVIIGVSAMFAINLLTFEAKPKPESIYVNTNWGGSYIRSAEQIGGGCRDYWEPGFGLVATWRVQIPVDNFFGTNVVDIHLASERGQAFCRWAMSNQWNRPLMQFCIVCKNYGTTGARCLATEINIPLELWKICKSPTADPMKEWVGFLVDLNNSPLNPGIRFIGMADGKDYVAAATPKGSNKIEDAREFGAYACQASNDTSFLRGPATERVYPGK